METLVTNIMRESIAVKQSLLEMVPQIIEIAEKMTLVLTRKGSIYLVGNGGSAADAEHIATELLGRFLMDRQPLPVHALTCNGPAMTAISNDYGYEQVFSRQLSGVIKAGDMVIGLSTSGTSPNIIKAILVAREQKAITVGFTGGNGGELSNITDHCIIVSSSHTPRIQEAHMLIGHILCELVEKALFEEHQ